MRMNSKRHIILSLQRLALVLALFVGGSLGASAQQAPDCNSCGCALPAMLGVTYSTSTTQTCGSTVNYNMNVGRYIRFWGVVGNVYSFSLCAQPGNTSMYITNATGAAIIGCDLDGCGVANGGALITFLPALSASYRLYVFGTGCANTFPDATMMQLSIDCAPAQVPTNNTPCTATVLPTNTNACSYVSGSNLGATNSNMAPAPAVCAGTNPQYQGADVWYQVQVPANGLLGIQTEEGDICAGMFEVYSSSNNACNGTFSAAGCSSVGLTGPTSEPAMIFDATAAGYTPGQWLWIRYWERGGNENGSFSICAFEAERPPNDDPCNATALPLNTTCVSSSYTFTNASASTVPPPTCGTTTYMSDVWFSFQVPAVLPGNYSGISVNTVDNDLLNLSMAWYRLSPTPCAPGNLTQIACNAAGSINSANISPTLLVPGETIYVRIWNEVQWIGTYDICALLNQAPANDTPCGAFALPVNYGCLMTTYSNASATTGATPASSCGAATNDVWFTAVMPASGPLQIDMLAGSMTNATMAIYTGACGSLNQLGPCYTAGSQQGAASAQMPYASITGPAPGTTLYIRVWRAGGTDGTFGICARRTDTPPGNCFYTLNMYDSAGDGWGGSYVTICVAGNCTNYTVAGLTASVSIGVNVGQLFTVDYTSAGGFENQNSYTITQYNSTIFAANSPPSQGNPLVYQQTVSCDPPPAPQSDCFGAVSVCNDATMFNQQAIPGSQELNNSNHGCLLGNEHWGLWYTFTAGTAGTITFDIDPVINMDYDFAVWGPFPNGSTVANMCPVTGAPLRCNFSGLYGNTGISSTPTTGAFSPAITANAGDSYVLYVDQWTGGPNYQFNLSWGGTADIVCNLPVEFLSLDAYPLDKNIMVEWATASELNSSHFEVERSADGTHFDHVGSVNAAGSSQNIRTYSFVDDGPLSGISYYRLKQVDLDGQYEYSRSVAVMMQDGNTMEVHPNPAQDMLWLSLHLAEENFLEWQIVDMSGRLVQKGSFAGGVGRNTQELQISHLDQGSYMLQVKDGGGSSVGVQRFMKN